MKTDSGLSVYVMDVNNCDCLHVSIIRVTSKSKILRILKKGI